MGFICILGLNGLVAEDKLSNKVLVYLSALKNLLGTFEFVTEFLKVTPASMLSESNSIADISVNEPVAANVSIP